MSSPVSSAVLRSLMYAGRSLSSDGPIKTQLGNKITFWKSSAIDRLNFIFHPFKYVPRLFKESMAFPVLSFGDIISISIYKASVDFRIFETIDVLLTHQL